MPSSQGHPIEITELLEQFHRYSNVRADFLALLQRGNSCRDPFAEFSEVLVARLLSATPAASRVQKGYDLVRPNGRHVQVKYLANPVQGWINEHTIHFTNDIEDYALVIFVDFRLKSVLVFPRETIGQVCKLLGKRHPHQETSLQFTEKNHKAILARQTEFHALGVEIYQFTETASDDIGSVG